MAETLDIVDELLPDIRLEFRRQFVYGACEHEILPDNKPQLVTDVIEPVFRIIAAAPYADRIVIRSNALAKELPRSLRRHPSKQMILRDIVRPHGKYGNTVHFMGKTLSPLVLLNPHSHSAKPDPAFPGICRLAVCIQGHFHRI